MRTILATAIAATTIVTCAGIAPATVVSFDYAYEAKGFKDDIGKNKPPVDPVTGSFSVTFDDAVPFTASTAGLNGFDINVPYKGEVKYSYQRTQNYQYLTFGTGLTAGSYGGALYPGTPGFFLALSFPNQTNTASVLAQYVTKKSNASFATRDVTVTRIGGAAPIPDVPEPASWAMLVLGFGMVGTVVRRRPRPAFA